MILKQASLVAVQELLGVDTLRVYADLQEEGVRQDSPSLKQASLVAVQELLGVDKLNTEFMLICGKKE